MPGGRPARPVGPSRVKSQQHVWSSTRRDDGRAGHIMMKNTVAGPGSSAWVKSSISLVYTLYDGDNKVYPRETRASEVSRAWQGLRLPLA